MKNANFPQLSKEVAENEAEAILHTSLGDIRIKPLSKVSSTCRWKTSLLTLKKVTTMVLPSIVWLTDLWFKAEIQKEMVPWWIYLAWQG